jgi:hypothetical protein
MKKEVICKNCKKSITVRSWANDRVELAREKGEFFNSLLFITVLVIMAILGYYLFNNFWGKSFYMIFALPIAIAIPGMIYFTYVKSQNGKVRDFNRFRK